jgi:hypothetical protein
MRPGIGVTIGKTGSTSVSSLVFGGLSVSTRLIYKRSDTPPTMAGIKDIYFSLLAKTAA